MMQLGLTFSDVLLVPKRTPLTSRGEANVQTRFTKNIQLNIPLVSSNMATVTEHKMAIALAREGGLGIIHQFCSVEEQVQEIKKVKRVTSYMVENPIAVSPRVTIKEAVDIMEAEGVTSLLVVMGTQLIGIFTCKDYQFEDDLNRNITEVMTPKNRLITSYPGVSLEEAKRILHQHRIEKLPLVENGELKGLITTKDILKLENWPNAARDAKGKLRVGAAIGVKDAVERARELISAGVDVLVLDVAHAHSDFVIQQLKELKKNFSIDIMVGNIATADAARELCEAGADGLKVGIGPSPVCTTRIIAGAGIPQLTAIIDVARIAKEYNVPITADGGMKSSGDVAKALAAGAHTIYSGTLFAGTKEAPGVVIFKDGKRFKKYSGSASYESSHARKESQNGTKIQKRMEVFVEGVSSLVDYRGAVQGIIKSIVKGVQSAISYCGARNIEQMHKNAEFIQITSSGWEESKGRGKELSE
ncbi:IMP dehydrogenase [Candidatus Woesearchaeota archaeon CG10_big_fil_rev_8_21_14_0_10_36_11]|nr:MAG: IMP dehydrogenase [Candidatus Woesearchaeota archaeon CG10_big_fil_rev_8_21_14_0_10_36_11]